MSPFDIQNRITGYNLNPHLYDDNQIAELKEYADIYGIPFSGSAENAKEARKSSGLLSQFSSGFTEGFLGPLSMGGWSEEPEDEAQAMAHSMGHLLGFALPMAGSLLTFGGSGVARLGLSATQVAVKAGTASKVGRAFNQGRRAVGWTGEALQSVGGAMRAGSPVSIAGIAEVPLKSVPLLGADALESWAKSQLAKHGFAVAKHIGRKGPITGVTKAVDIAFQAGHLSVASGISGLFNGENDEMNNLLFGAVAGGAFGGLGNFVTMGKMIKHPNAKIRGAGMKGLWNYSKEFATGNKERLLSMVAGAGFQGGMATMQGAPTATQVYEYLLGGFFGYQAQGAVAKQANDYFNKFNSEKNSDGTNKYTFEDVRKMAEKGNPEFEALDPGAQKIVKEAHFHHLGEMYDNTLSIPSATLYEAMKAELPRAEKRMAEKLNKKVEDLDKYEKRQAEAEVADTVPPKVMAMEKRNEIVNTVYQAILTDKPSKAVLEITKNLSDKDLLAVKNGNPESLDRAILDYFASKPHDKVQTTYDDILKTQIQLQKGQPELSSAPMLKRFLDKLQDKLVELPNIKPEKVFNDAIKLFNKKDIKNSNDVTSAVKAYLKALTFKHKGLIIDKDMERGLGQLFTRIQQEEIRPIYSINVDKSEVTQVWHKNVVNKVLGVLSPKPADEVINMEKGLWSDKVRVFEFGEVVKTKWGEYRTFSPYAKSLNTTTNRWEYEIKPSDWIKIQRHLWSSKDKFDGRGEFYLKIPKKDNGVERIYRFHKDTRKTRAYTIFGEVSKKAKIEPKLLESYYKTDREVWYNTMGMTRDKVKGEDRTFLDRVYSDSFTSNYLYEKSYNFKGAVDRVKREALFSAKSFFQVNPKDFTKMTKGTDEIDIFIIDDSSGLLGGLKNKAKRLFDKKKPETYYVLNEKGMLEERAWESKIDGWIVMHSDMHKQFLKSNHLEDRTSHIKPSVAVEINGELFLIKGGVHPGRKAYDKFLKNPNAMIVVTSSAKHIPQSVKDSGKIYKAQSRGKTIFEAIDSKGKKIDVEPSLRMPIKDFRINFGVYGDSHSARATTIKKQMHSFFDDLTMSKVGFDKFMDSVLEIPLRGSPETNTYMKSLEKDSSVLPPKNFDISKVSDKHLVEIVNNVNHPLFKEMNLEIFKKIRALEIEEEMPEMHGSLMELKQYANSFEQTYHLTGYNPIATVLNMNLYQRAVHQYRINRFNQPKWENSASGWVAGVDPVMEAMTGGLKENATYQFWNGKGMTKQKVGHVKLGESHKDMKIKWVDGRVERLEDAFNEYNDAIKNKSGEVAISRMRQQLLLAVMRVPANAVSGTRALLFDGFVDNDVQLSDYGVYMRARDHFYIDGADVDGDKVFFYQGLPKEYMRDLVKNDDMLERVKKVGKETKKYIFENKDEKLNKLFNSELGTKKNKYGVSEVDYVENNPLGQWSPGALRKAGQSSFAGKEGMGRVVNTKSFMNTVLSDIIKNKKGILDLKVYSKKGAYLGRLTGKTSEAILRGPTGYYVIGVEASSRTADSANYYRMADANEMVEILWKSAFKNLKFTPKNKLSPIDSPKFWMLKNSETYNQIHDLNQKLFGWNYDKNRKYSAEEIQETLKNTKIDGSYMNSILTIANHMSKNNLNINPLSSFNFGHLDRAIRLIGTNIWRDKDVLDFAVRKNLTIKPQYWRIAYDRVYDIMSKKHPDYRTQKGAPLEEIGSGGKGKAPYADFIFEGLKGELTKSQQSTFDKMYTNDRANAEGFHYMPISKHHASKERDYRLNDTWDIYSVISALQNGKRLKNAIKDEGLTTEGAGNVPYQEINNLAFKIISGGKLSASEQVTSTRWKKKVQEAINVIQGMPEGQMDVFTKYKTPMSKEQNDWTVFRDNIATYANHVKGLFRKGFRDKEVAVYETKESANKKVLEYADHIIKTAESMGIDPRIALDYYYSQLLGSLTPQTFTKRSKLRNLERLKNETKSESKKDEIQKVIDNINDNYEHTGIPKFAWELTAIPDSFKKEFLTGYGKTFDILNTHRPQDLKSYKAEFFYRNNETVEKTEPRSTPEFVEQKEFKIDRLFDVKKPKNIDKSKVPSDITNKVIPSIKRTLRTLPFELTSQINDIYVLMKSQQGKISSTSIRNATFDDIRNFDRFLKEYIEAGANPKSNSKKEWVFKFKNIYELLFPDVVGQRMSTHDLGELYSIKVLARNLDGGAGEATIKVPLSAMSYLQRSSNSIRRFEDSVKNQLQENLFKSIGIKQEIEALPNGIEHFQKIMEIAVKKMNVNRTLEGDRLQFYQEELSVSKKDILDYSERIFRITRDGKTIEKSGEELITEVTEQLNTFFKEEMYESWIGSGLLNKNKEWEKIDWKEVDERRAYEGSGLVIHSLIKYDKWGRFDIDNFYNKVIKLASEGHWQFERMIGNRNSPLSVELLNRVQYEIALEEIIEANKHKPNSIQAQNIRAKHRNPTRTDRLSKEEVFNETTFVGIGQIKDGYFPQMLHNKDKLMSWMNEQQNKLRFQLENHLNTLTSSGKLTESSKEISKKYKPSEYDNRLYLGLIKDRSISKKQFISKYLAKQLADLEGIIGKAVEGDNTGTWGIEFVNSMYRDSKKDWADKESFGMRPGTGASRGDVPMPHFSYNPEVLQKYAEQWTSSFFKNTLSLMARKTIRNYEKDNPMPEEIYSRWSDEMRGFTQDQLGHGALLPIHRLGLSKYQVKRIKAYIDENKDNKDSKVQEIIVNYQHRLRADEQFKKQTGVKGIRYTISDQAIIDWLDIKSQGLGRLTGKLKGFGTIKQPALPIIGKLPPTQKAREKALHDFLTNVGNFEAKMSLLSLLAHPKTALGNIFGGSQNTISNAGFRNFIKANDTKWLLTHVFKDAKLADGTPISDKNTIRRFISEVGALESFYVTEASMDKGLSITRMRPFLNEIPWGKLFTKEMTQVKWKEIAQKHRVWDSMVASGGWFMRVSEARLRADAFLAHYLQAREIYGQLIPNLKFDNPYLIRQALKGVEATQFLYHNVNRPSFSRSAMGKVLTRFQPFAWNSVKFRRNIYKMAKRYGMTDKQSVDRLRRFVTQDLMVASLANIFIGSIFDSTLPPPLSWAQSSAELLFGDPEERERAFFSSYPHPAMAPLQTVTAPIHRYYLPVITALINGDWDKYTSYYVHTLYPGGRFARSIYKTMQSPEMFPEFMFGIPVHKLGANMRKARKEDEEE